MKSVEDCPLIKKNKDEVGIPEILTHIDRCYGYPLNSYIPCAKCYECDRLVQFKKWMKRFEGEDK